MWLQYQSPPKNKTTMTIAGKQSQVIIFLFENKSTTPSTPRNNGTPKAQARTARKFWTRSRCWSYCHCYLTCILWNRGLQCGKHRPKRRHLVVCLLCYMSKWHATAASQHRCPFELAPTAIVHAIKSYLWGVAILKCAALSVVILLMSSYQPTHESSCSKTRLVVYYHPKKKTPGAQTRNLQGPVTRLPHWCWNLMEIVLVSSPRWHLPVLDRSKAKPRPGVKF